MKRPAMGYLRLLLAGRAASGQGVMRRAVVLALGLGACVLDRAVPDRTLHCEQSACPTGLTCVEEAGEKLCCRDPRCGRDGGPRALDAVDDRLEPPDSR